jgi:hypothetical protein
MRIATTMALLIAASGCGGGMSMVAEYDADAEASLEAYARANMDAAGSGNFAALHTTADEAVMYDMGEHGEPIAADGATGGATSEATTTRVDCHATTNHGWCAVEFEVSMTANGQAMGPFRMRATMVARRNGDAWVWTHWHASMREMPPGMGAPPADGPAAGTPPPAEGAAPTS